MEIIQLTIALLTAGVALFAGLVSLSTGLHKDGEKTDLIFGFLCLAIFLFFLCPPLGFIMADKAPYAINIIIKRIFNFSFFSLFPWFVFFYTGYRKKFLPILISSLNFLTYILMVFAQKDTHAPIWVGRNRAFNRTWFYCCKTSIQIWSKDECKMVSVGNVCLSFFICGFDYLSDKH
jgi:hypothetical protein